MFLTVSECPLIGSSGVDGRLRRLPFSRCAVTSIAITLTVPRSVLVSRFFGFFSGVLVALDVSPPDVSCTADVVSAAFSAGLIACPFDTLSSVAFTSEVVSFSSVAGSSPFTFVSCRIVFTCDESPVEVKPMSKEWVLALCYSRMMNACIREGVKKRKQNTVMLSSEL